MSNEIIVKMKYGSHLYGTNLITSDLDIKGVFFPTKNQLFLNNIPKTYTQNTKHNSTEKNTVDDIDFQLYSLHYFIQLACKGETNVIDMLHVNDENLIETSDIWKEIVKNKSKFYSKNLDSFIGYAKVQADKYGVSSSRMHTIEQLITIFNTYDKSKKLKDYWNELPNLNHTSIDHIDNKTNIKMYEIASKLFQETVTVEYVLTWLNKFYNTYGERVRLAKENKNVDFKALSHAVRAALQLKEIYLTSDLKYPLKDKDLLIDIKLGKMDFVTEVEPLLTSLIKEVKELSQNSNFPEHADVEFWNNFIIETINNKYIRNIIYENCN